MLAATDDGAVFDHGAGHDNGIFNDVFKKYLVKHELVNVKTTNMGSLFKLRYEITLRDPRKEKEFIDELRCRNGNLEIICSRAELSQEIL